MPQTIDPLVPKESTRNAAISELWKAQHGIKVAAQALQDCNALASAYPVLHVALLPLIKQAVELHSATVAVRQALEQT